MRTALAASHAVFLGYAQVDAQYAKMCGAPDEEWVEFPQLSGQYRGDQVD